MTDAELNPFFKSVLEQDRAHIVICDLDHTIIYMNPAADRSYEKYGGHSLIGKSLLDCHNPHSCEMIKRVVDWFRKSKDNDLVYTYKNEKHNKDVYMVALRNSDSELIGYYEKHEFRNSETMPLYSLD